MKKKTNKQDVFIIYEYNEFENDYRSIKEYLSIKELQEEASKEYNIKNPVSIYHYITDSIERPKKMLNNKYIIIKELADVIDLY